MTKKICLALLVGGMLCCMFPRPAFAALILAESDFSTGLDGWTTNVPSEVSWESTGGNPGGYVRHEDGAGSSSFLIAPSKFLGDWSGADGVGGLSFDHRIFSTGFIGDQAIFPYFVSISGPGGSALWEGDTATGATDWLTVNAPINESDWTVTGVWDDLLLNVTNLQLKIEYVDNDDSRSRDISGIDNVRFFVNEANASVVPEPASALFFGLGMVGIGWVRRRLSV